MPSSLNTSSVVSRSKDRKCKKPCQSSSSSSCCTEQCLDCCSSQYQRLSRFANLVATNQVATVGGSGTWNVAVNLSSSGNANILNRSGAVIPIPSATLSTALGVPGAYPMKMVVLVVKPTLQLHLWVAPPVLYLLSIPREAIC